jgi:hypothetical protein
MSGSTASPPCSAAVRGGSRQTASGTRGIEFYSIPLMRDASEKKLQQDANNAQQVQVLTLISCYSKHTDVGPSVMPPPCSEHLDVAVTA